MACVECLFVCFRTVCFCRWLVSNCFCIWLFDLSVFTDACVELFVCFCRWLVSVCICRWLVWNCLFLQMDLCRTVCLFLQMACVELSVFADDLCIELFVFADGLCRTVCFYRWLVSYCLFVFADGLCRTVCFYR